MWTAITASTLALFSARSDGETQNVFGSMSIKRGRHPALLRALKTTGQQNSGTPTDAPVDNPRAFRATMMPVLAEQTGRQNPNSEMESGSRDRVDTATHNPRIKSE